MSISRLLPPALLAAALSGPGQESRRYAAPHARLLTSDGGRVDWSKQNQIAFDRKGQGGFYQIWAVNPEGTGERCLTCGQPGAPQKHKGNPAWHPSGRYVVFEAQKDR